MSQPRAHSAAKISFSWEKKPGVSKVTDAASVPGEQEPLTKLPPPPCTAEAAKNSVYDLQIPLPPCAFQPPYYRTSSKKGLWMQDDDPFLAAYKECTKNRKSADNKLPKTAFESRLRKSMSFFSCKRSSTVRDNKLVRISQLPHNVDGD